MEQGFFAGFLSDIFHVSIRLVGPISRALELRNLIIIIMIIKGLLKSHSYILWSTKFFSGPKAQKELKNFYRLVFLNSG